MRDDYKYIRVILERYYQGTSSDEEEKKLIDFFMNEKDIPSDLEPDQRLFVSMAADPEAPADLSRKIMAEVDRRERRRSWRLVAISTAAVLICVVFAALIYIETDERMPSPVLAEQQEVSNDAVLIATQVSDDSESRIAIAESSKGVEIEMSDKKGGGVVTIRKEELKGESQPDEQEKDAMEYAFRILGKVGRQLKEADDKLAIVDTKVDKAYSQVYDVINNLNKNSHEEY